MLGMNFHAWRNARDYLQLQFKRSHVLLIDLIEIYLRAKVLWYLSWRVHVKQSFSRKDFDEYLAAVLSLLSKYQITCGMTSSC